MKRLVLAILFIFNWAPFYSHGQSMVHVFKLLPAECTPELSALQRDALIKNKEFTAPDEETGETTRYELEVDEKRGYLKYTYYYSYGQKGFNTYEVRKFQRKDRSWLIVFSTYGGATRSYDQAAVYGFSYRSNKLIRIFKPILPEKIDVNVFLKANTPDSIRNLVKKYSSRSYDLSPDQERGIAYRVFFETIDETIEKYLLGDMLDFIWTGDAFKRGQVNYLE